MHCWGMTGILAIWNVDASERALLASTAFAEVARLFLDIKSMIQAVQSMMKTTKSCLKI